ncbi:hypothetical protein DFH28DRAFT_930295 [Melampsora americana]|nr:hypothetical protein DFH28DRAFT_930295 [Melampsora americana]
MAKCLKIHSSKDKDTGDIIMQMVVEPKFESDQYRTVKVKDFRRCYTEILLEDGQFLMDCGVLKSGGGISGEAYKVVDLPNPWQKWADGKLIQHVPITLYSDDTSGYVSKKWNKHMSFYCTLSGLPPKLTNQEFNMHFNYTSNTALAVELGEYLIDQIKPTHAQVNMTASSKTRIPKTNAPQSKSTSGTPMSPGEAINEEGENGYIEGMLIGSSATTRPATSSQTPSGADLIEDPAPNAEEAIDLTRKDQGSPKKSTTRASTNTRSPTKASTLDKTGHGGSSATSQYLSVLSSVPLVNQASPNPASNQKATDASSMIDLNDKKAVWEMAMSLAVAGKESEAAMYFKIHERISLTSEPPSTAVVPAKRRPDGLTPTSSSSSTEPKSLDGITLPAGAVIEGGIVFIPGAITEHTDTGLPAFFQKNIRELSGLLPLTVFSKSWQNDANAYHHEKKFKNEESSGVVAAWRGYPYPHKMTQSYAEWDVNFSNFVYALRKVYHLERMATCAEAHRANVAFIHSQYNWMTAFRYDIAIRLNFFSHKVTVDGILSAIDISQRQDDIANMCYADVRRCDEGHFKDNPYAEGNSRFGFDWNTGLPRVRGGSNNNQPAPSDNHSRISTNRNGNSRNFRRNNNYHHHNSDATNNNHHNGYADHSNNSHNPHEHGNKSNYAGRNYDPNYKAKKAAAAAAPKPAPNIA